MLCPVAVTAAFPHDQKGLRHQRTIVVNNKKVPVVDQIFWAGYSGVTYLPATAAPIGQTKDGLPIGVQIIGPQYGDYTASSSPSCWRRNTAASNRRRPTAEPGRRDDMTKDIDLKKHIRSIPDFPKPGILFYDISTLLAHAKAWHATIERMADMLRPYKPDVLAGIESRGFLLAAPLALALGTGFVMMRKQGKLPGITVRHTYALEYGTDTIEIQTDAIKKGAARGAGRRPAGDRRHPGGGGHAAASRSAAWCRRRPA